MNDDESNVIQCQLVPIHSLSVCFCFVFLLLLLLFFWNISEVEKNVQTSPLWCDYRTEREREREPNLSLSNEKSMLLSASGLPPGILLFSRCHYCHPRHLSRPARRLGADRPPRRTLRWQCDRRGIDQASELNGPAAIGFSQPYLSSKNRSIKSFDKKLILSFVLFYSPKTSIVPTSSNLRRHMSIVHSEPIVRKLQLKKRSLTTTRYHC